MRRIYRATWAILAVIIGAWLTAGCAPTPTPAPTTPPPTPLRAVTVVVTRAPATLPPSWTPEPTRTPPPTSTRLPTSTPPATRTPVASWTPIGGQIGVIGPGDLITVEVSLDAINAALADLRESPAFSPDINRAPAARILGDGLEMRVSFNDLSSQSVVADFRFGLLNMRSELTVNLLGFETPGGRSLDADKVRAAMAILRSALADVTIPAAVREFDPTMAAYQLRGLSYGRDKLQVTLRITSRVEPTAEATTGA
ncbi:MAG: hypothetical protein IT323_10105 [Anaerolineae bacterium]|nr:hypothetical protein [Anaerolineae bacterium]